MLVFIDSLGWEMGLGTGRIDAVDYTKHDTGEKGNRNKGVVFYLQFGIIC